MAGKKAYRIWCPPFSPRSGGIRALHRLARLLEERGFEASINADPRNPKYVAVYPEVIPESNPFLAKDLVYYFLNRPGLLGGTTEFQGGALKFWYASFLSPPPGDPLLTIPTIELEWFNTAGAGVRDTTCSHIGKAMTLGYMQGIPLGDSHISPTWPATRPEVAALLRRSTVLYCYDGLTALTMEAALCGCPSVIMQEGPFKRADVEKSEFGTAGLCWRLDELPRARETLPLALPNYLRVEEGMKGQLSKFIEITQAM